MNVSPLDLRQTRFRSAFRGFDRVEVTTFMAAVADDYEQALRETDKLLYYLVLLEVVFK
jgi:DivIVA domain-containing protein